MIFSVNIKIYLIAILFLFFDIYIKYMNISNLEGINLDNLYCNKCMKRSLKILGH